MFSEYIFCTKRENAMHMGKICCQIPALKFKCNYEFMSSASIMLGKPFLLFTPVLNCTI